MIRLNIVLLIAVLLSAFYLIPLRYQWRKNYTAVHAEQKNARELANESKVLDVRKRTQAASLRVANIARKKLAMRTNDPSITQYIVRKKSKDIAVIQTTTYSHDVAVRDKRVLP